MSPIDVFDVDKNQLWEWAGWQNRYSENIGVQNEADSLRKGSYIVLSNYACFGFMQVRPIVWECFGSLRAALAYIDVITNRLGYNYHSSSHIEGKGYGEEYEVWHVVEGAYAHMVPDSPATIEVYDIQVSAFCDLCESAEDADTCGGLGSFGYFCPIEQGHRYVLVDMVDGGKPFALHSSDEPDTLRQMAEGISETKDGKPVEWEIWRIVEDVVAPDYDSPELQARICEEVEELEGRLFVLAYYMESLASADYVMAAVV